MSNENRIGTPWPSQRRSVAVRGTAPTPEEVASRPKGPPPGSGRLPGQGIPPTQGVPPEKGVPPTAGLPPGTGLPPGVEGQRPRGVEGQMDRGTPGQMDPWAENPWSADQGAEDDWQAVPPAPDAVADDAFYLHHPNLQGTGDKGEG